MWSMTEWGNLRNVEGQASLVTAIVRIIVYQRPICYELGFWPVALLGGGGSFKRWDLVGSLLGI
jgi:hypothetical protein